MTVAMIICTGCGQPFEPEPGQAHTMCLSCQEIDWYALSNGLFTVMSDGTRVNDDVDDGDS